MEIKQIKKGKKNTYCLLLDNHIEEIFYDDIIVKYSLIPKKKLTLIELQQIKQENNTLESYYQSIEYLTLRLRSKKEMKLYLEKKGYEKLTIQKTIEKLEKEGYLNETEYIKCFLADAFRFSNDGPYKIKKRLIDLGCNKDNIELELEKYSKEEWLSKLEKLYQKKINSKHKEGKEKWLQKCNHYVYQLGYPENWIEEISKKVECPEDNSMIEREYDKLHRKWSRKLSGKELNFKLKIKLYEKGFSKELIAEIIENKK